MNIRNIELVNNPAKFDDDYHFRIKFEAIAPLAEGEHRFARRVSTLYRGGGRTGRSAERRGGKLAAKGSQKGWLVCSAPREEDRVDALSWLMPLRQ